MTKYAPGAGSAESLFYHPDCTVGTGISPVHATISNGLRTVTAGQDFHLASKMTVL